MDDGNSHIKLIDGARLDIGSSADLQIYHSSGENFIRGNASASTLFIDCCNELQIRHLDTNGANSEKMIVCNDDGAVELYHDNSKKLHTHSAGVNIEGNIIIDHTAGTDGKGEIAFGESGRPFIDGFDNGNHGSGAGFDFRAGNADYFIKTRQDAAVELYYDNSKKLETLSNGVSVTGSVFSSGLSTSSGNLFINNNDTTNGVITIATNTNDCWRFEFNGDFEPHVDNQVNIGSSTKRVANVFTTDLHLSNRGSQNDVDATWGDYTIQEGHEELFLLNHRTGKKFKFNLTEVS